MLSHNEVQNPTDPRVENILESGVKNFQKYGYRKASIDEISKDAGISKPTFYKYFKSKEELFFGVRIYLGREVKRDFNQACRQCENASEKLHIYFKKLEEFSLSDKSFTETFDNNRELRRNWSYHTWGREAYQNSHEIIKNIIVEGIANDEFRTEEPGVLAHKVVISVAMLGILRRSPPRFMKPEDSAADFVFDLLLNGIKR